ncbi:MAG: MFS transporter, partial [Rhizobiales bacterium]|nr:MFS transporter [Hyphomicrobiales bacterium]
LAVTSHLLSLAVFIPPSGWTDDRFGARNVFRIAMAVFMAGSLVCAASESLSMFVAGRIIQGAGSAMMTPVGRLLLLRSVDKKSLVDAMAWLTVPALIGPVVGPPLGGFITTYATWHWIFLINIPVGVTGIILATRYIPDVRTEMLDPIDLTGLIYSGIAVAGLAFGLSVAGLDVIPTSMTLSLLIMGTIGAVAYRRHAARTAAPALDFSLLAVSTFRANLIGGSMFRLGVGAMPFLLPLLMQLGFGLTPFESGMVTFASAAGSLIMKTVAAKVLRRFGFRPVLVFNALISACFIAACALFRPDTPIAVIIIVLLVGGFFRSLEFTSVNTIAYADIDPEHMSRATTLVSVGQQLSVSAGVALGAFIVDIGQRMSPTQSITAADFAPAFLVIAAISASSALVFRRLPADAAAHLSGRVAPTPGNPEKPVA